MLGQIGAGGMGEVFVARDPHLGRKVAIKMLPVRLAQQRDTLSRFAQEARSASALNHPNIVTIHEIATDADVPYIVMEFVEGRDLRSMINEGPIPVRKVLEIGAQIADGLAAAHERGIVHRDLKPENIMVTADGYAKILDFGLAKMMNPQPEGNHTWELEVPGTTPGVILGTIGYMSPEQARGGRIDFRSDQFALGAILYEMTTGKAAFESETAVDTLAAILHHDPTPLVKVNPAAPVQLGDIIKRLLAKSPDDRYRSSRDLAQELRILRDRVIAEESGFHVSRPYPQPRRWTTTRIIGGLALAVFLAVVLFKMWPTRPGPPPPPPTRYLAVLGFKDLTGDPNGQLVVDGFGETLRARLAHYPTIQVMRADDVNADPRKVARDLGANLILRGTMMRNGDRLRVTYEIVKPEGTQESSDLVDGNVSDLFGVQDDVAQSVAAKLSLGPVPARPPLDPAVSQRRYLEAIGHLRRYDKAESLDSAIAILAGLGDSPSVQAALGRAYLHKYIITNEPELAAKAGQAVESALKRDPQSLDVNITLGQLRYETGRYSEAVAAYVRVLSQQPNNYDAFIGLGDTYKADGDFKKAEESYRRAVSLQPRYWGGYNRLGWLFAAQKRPADAVPMYRKVIELVPDNQRAYNNLGGMYLLLGRPEEAVKVFQDSIRRAPSGQGYSNLGTTYYSMGRYADAAAAFEKAVELTPAECLYWRNLGDAYRWAPGQQEKARGAYERAVARCDDAIDLNANNARAHRSRASALAKLGRPREARKAIIRALEIEPQSPDNAYEAAVINNISRDEEETVLRLEQALRFGYPPDDLLRDPEFANLKQSGTLQSVITAFKANPSPN